jgi:hypothetical protein
MIYISNNNLIYKYDVLDVVLLSGIVDGNGWLKLFI